MVISSTLLLFSIGVSCVAGAPNAASVPVKWKVPGKDWCKNLRSVSNGSVGKSVKRMRGHTASIVDFGGIGDGLTLNTLAFQRAVSYLSSFSKKGGGQLNVPPGKWLTGSFNLTSHFTLFLHKDAVILGSQVLDSPNNLLNTCLHVDIACVSLVLLQAKKGVINIIKLFS